MKEGGHCRFPDKGEEKRRFLVVFSNSVYSYVKGFANFPHAFQPSLHTNKHLIIILLLATEHLVRQKSKIEA